MNKDVVSWAAPYAPRDVGYFLTGMLSRIVHNLMRRDNGMPELDVTPNKYDRSVKPLWSGCPGEPYTVQYDFDGGQANQNMERMCGKGVTLGLWTVHSRAQSHKKIGPTGKDNSLLRFNPERFEDLVELVMPPGTKMDVVGEWAQARPTWRLTPWRVPLQNLWVWAHRGELEFATLEGEDKLIWRRKGSWSADLDLGLQVMGKVQRNWHSFSELSDEFGVSKLVLRREGYLEGAEATFLKNLKARRRDLLEKIADYKKTRKAYRGLVALGGHEGLVRKVGASMRALLEDKAPLLAAAGAAARHGDKEAVLAELAEAWLAGNLKTVNNPNNGVHNG